MLELMTWQGEYEGYAPRHMWLTEAGEDLALLFTGGRPSQYSHIDSPATIRRPWFKFAVFSRDRHLIQFYLFYFTQLKTRRLVSKYALVLFVPDRRPRRRGGAMCVGSLYTRSTGVEVRLFVIG